jgi:adenosylmethionine-8-amino-7-oxononanoate aminotransferase
VAIFRDAYGPLLRNNLLVPFPSDAGALAALEQTLETRHDEIAAVIVEPLVQGASGMRMYDAVYLQQASALCKQYGVHLIADEILTGFGRTGTMFAHEQAGIRPDFLCLSKGITGGYLPLSCVLTTDAVYDAFYDDKTARGFLHSHSYTGNALACRAALETLNIFEDDNVIESNRAKAVRFDAMADALRAHRFVRDWRRLGMIWAFEVSTPHADFAKRAFALSLEQGVLLRPIGNTVYFMPPYIVGEEEFDRLVSTATAIADQLGDAA